MPFQQKKFKKKIGTKTDVNEVKIVKRFTNGHKCFTSSEAKRMVEQQSRERVTSDIFNQRVMELSRPRNPLNGEETPREGNVYKERKILGFPLIPPDRPLAKSLPSPKAVTLKVGQYESDIVTSC